MKYHEAINELEGNLWKTEVVKEHQRMIDCGVFEPMKLSKVTKGDKLIDTTWAMKKKISETLRGRVNVKGFKQIDEQHYDGTCISAPVTNAMTIRIALSIMLMQSGIAHIVDIKGAFLYGEFDDGKKICIKIPLGFEKFYLSNTVLLLKKMLYGLKQAAMAFYRKLLVATQNIRLKMSTADPCLYYKWERGSLVIMISWINDNIILGPEDLVMQVKTNLMKQFSAIIVGISKSMLGTRSNMLEMTQFDSCK
jgi:hypothetical protein